MTSGTIASSCIYPASSGINAGAYDSRAVVSYPFASAIATSAQGGTLTQHIPTVPAYSKTGTKQTSFFDDFCNRIHITPAALPLGNVVSNFTKPVRIWNSWLSTTRTLNAFNGSNTSGITDTAPAALPITFEPNQELSWTFAISVQGPPTIDAVYTAAFTDGESVTLTITGSRITAWAVTPDWGTGVKETLEFKTDVMIAWSGMEMRRALRIAPRRLFDFEAPVGQQERRVIEASLFGWSSKIWALPIFSDGQRLPSLVASGATSVPCDTVGRDFVAGGLAILITDAANYEVLQVSTVSGTALTLSTATVNNWAAGSRLYPVRSARLDGYPKLTRLNGQYASLRAQFATVEPCDYPVATGLAQYRGYPVLEDSPDDSIGDDASYERQANLIDSDTGVVEIDDTANIGFPVLTHAWFMQGRTQRAAFRSLMYLLKGRQGEIWVPTYQSDLEVVAPISSGATTINVELTGYGLFLQGQVNRQDIRVELVNGTVEYRRITASVGIDADTEQITIDSALGGGTILQSQIRRISYMALCRLNTDSIDINHVNGDQGIATAATQFRGTNNSA